MTPSLLPGAPCCVHLCVAVCLCSTDLIRAEIAQAGYDECLTLGLCSIEENFGMLRRTYREGDAVVVANPKTDEFQVTPRTALFWD